MTNFNLFKLFLLIFCLLFSLAALKISLTSFKPVNNQVVVTASSTNVIKSIDRPVVKKDESLISLDKNSNILLKYSKTKFLDQQYIPEPLVSIDNTVAFDRNKKLQIIEPVYQPLLNLVQQARVDGIDLSILSAYRSYKTQVALKKYYIDHYGKKEADTFSANAGFSEHQLGSVVDFTNQTVGSELTGFEKTPSYDWLMKNAYKYGFVLSYPADNNYFVFEPWHWRFVGLELAYYLHNTNKHLNDLSQEEIDQYRQNIFKTSLIKN